MTLRSRARLQSFVVGPRFRGVKMLPPGPHLVSYNAASGGGAELAPTTAFFAHVPARGVLVRRWDAAAELLADVGEEEARAPLPGACGCLEALGACRRQA